MDQCFSSTRQKLPVDDIKEMPDIVRNGFTFSDGLVLEVIRGSTFISAYLNRQAIILLSALGTPDEVFIELKDLRVRELDKMLESEHTALDFLQRRIKFIARSGDLDGDDFT
ncbi:uncharacterized protein OCT59_001471 [Rhizophagus irregularis]|nr:hypothetical protein OCT59_001471 [Rhizophagus irregularis]